MALEICDVPGHACWGHRCDRCEHCEAGVCCGEAVVTVDLPAEGDWPTEPAVPIGTMHITADGALICHVCGQAHVGLFKHVAVHGLTADSYRAIFGLRSTQSLMSPVNSDARAERTGQQWREMDPRQRKAAAERLAKVRPQVTAEQRSEIVYRREQRSQARGPGTFYDPQAQSDRSVAFHAQRRADPGKDRAWRGRLILAKRKKVDDGQHCVVCDVAFCVVNARAVKQRSGRKTCGDPECLREVKRRAQAASAAARKAARTAQQS